MQTGGFKKRPQTPQEFLAGADFDNLQNQSFTPTITNNTQAHNNKTNKEKIVQIALRLPESLWQRFDTFEKTMATRAQSKNKVVLDLLDEFLTSKGL